MRRLLLLVGLAMMGTVLFASAALAQDPSAFNCEDFATQEEAQAFFEANDPANDPYLLDEAPGADDAVPCEDWPSGGTVPAPPDPDDDASPPADEPDDAQYGPDDVQYETVPPTPLPETGGPVSAAGVVPMALMVVGGLLALRVVRRG